MVVEDGEPFAQFSCATRALASDDGDGEGEAADDGTSVGVAAAGDGALTLLAVVALARHC